MKILLVSQHYRPEPINSYRIAEGLAARGHEVWALVGEPCYPAGAVYAGYDTSRRVEEDLGGVHVVRCPLHPRKKGLVHRIWNYYSFSSSGVREQRRLPSDFDAVLGYQTSPVMMANPAIAYARRTGVPLMLYCLDIWPACLTAGGISEGSRVFEHYRGVSRRIYQAADRIAISSPLYEDYLRDEVGVEFGSCPVLLPHFAPEEFCSAEVPLPSTDYDPQRINLTFAGNIGTVQSVETIVIAAAILAVDPRFAFHIVGSGSALERCRALAEELGCTNVIFHGRHPEGEMPAFYAASDAMIVSFADEMLSGYTIPLKLHTYLAAGMPVISSASGEVSRVVEQAGCGFTAPAEDAEAFALACLELARCSAEDKDRMSRAARGYYESHFSEEHFFGTLQTALEQLRGTRHGSIV